MPQRSTRRNAFWGTKSTHHTRAKGGKFQDVSKHESPAAARRASLAEAKRERLAQKKQERAERIAAAGSYRGYKISKTPSGEYFSSLDPQSWFETKARAKKFIDDWRKGRGNPSPRKNVTDRMHRYRANELVEGPAVCAFCGSKRFLVPDHVNGKPDDTRPENLMYLCKSCNTAKGAAFRKAGIGRATFQYNPTKSGGAATIGEWVRAVGSIVPHKGAQYSGENYGLVAAMPVSEAVAMIRATPASRRSEFASQLGKHRRGRSRSNPSGVSCPSCGGERIGLSGQKVKCQDCGKQFTEAKSRSKRNPAAAADAAFEDFHGYPPTETVEVTKRVHVHRHLASAGVLASLSIRPIDRSRPERTLRGFGKNCFLSFNEKRNQLFVEGGDQALSKAELKHFGITSPHELETLGRATDIGYITDKKHLGAEGGPAVYEHGFRTTNENGEHVIVTVARYPDVIYRVLDEQLEFSGGSYTIKREGIDQ